MSRYFFSTEHTILKKWLSGTTCDSYYVRRSVLFESTDHVVLKHNSHASYAGRMLGSMTCKAFVVLYRKADLAVDSQGRNHNLTIGGGELLRWEGRTAKNRILDDCEKLGILFDKELSSHKSV